MARHQAKRVPSGVLANPSSTRKIWRIHARSKSDASESEPTTLSRWASGEYNFVLSAVSRRLRRLLGLPHFIAYRTSGADRAIGLDDVCAAEPHVAGMAAGKLREISSSQELENVLELVRDPFAGMPARRNDDVGYDQP